jgi:hypothetical protein
MPQFRELVISNRELWWKLVGGILIHREAQEAATSDYKLNNLLHFHQTSQGEAEANTARVRQECLRKHPDFEHHIDLKQSLKMYHPRDLPQFCICKSSVI